MMKSFALTLSLTSSLLNEFAFGSLNCDRVEYTLSYSGGYADNILLPTGVCIPNNYGSNMYVCNGNDKINVYAYDSNDCSGAPWDIHSLYDSLTSYENVTSYSVTCCTGNPCPFAVEKDYYALSNCSQDIQGVDFSADAYIIGSCLPSSWDSTKYVSCSDGELVQQQYWSTDCSGTIYSTNNISLAKCDENDYYKRKEVICGTAIDTCSTSFQSSTTTHKPIEPTGSGTAPSKSLDCNGIEIEFESINMAIPTGVCVNVEKSISYELKCGYDDQISYYVYDNKDCDGDSPLSGKVSVGANQLMDQSFNVFNSVCDKGPCHYGLFKAYNTTFEDESDCDEFVQSPDNSYFQQVFVSGYCTSLMGIGSVSVTCDGDTVTANEYLGGECSGSSLQHQQMSTDESQCMNGDINFDLNGNLGSTASDLGSNDTIASFRAIEVTCGIAEDTEGAPIIMIVSITTSGLVFICLICICYCYCRRRGVDGIKLCQLTNFLFKTGSVQIEFNKLDDNLKENE